MIFGISHSKGEAVIAKINCPNCNAEQILFQVAVKYFHIFWIPVFPIQKLVAGQCLHCKKVFDSSNFNQAMYTFSSHLIQKKRYSVAHYIGIILFASVVLLNLIPTQEKVRKANDKTAGDYYNQAVKLHNDGKKDECIKMLKLALIQSNISAEVKSKLLNGIAQVYEEMHIKDSAIVYLNRKAELYERYSPDYLVCLAGIYQLEGKTDSAIATYEALWTLDSMDLVINNNLGLLYMGNYGSDTINYEIALKFNKLAHKISPQVSTEENLIQNYRGWKEYNKVAEHYLSLYNKYPEKHSYLYNYAVILNEELKQSENAKKAAKELIELDSTYKDYYSIKKILN